MVKFYKLFVILSLAISVTCVGPFDPDYYEAEGNEVDGPEGPVYSNVYVPKNPQKFVARTTRVPVTSPQDDDGYETFEGQVAPPKPPRGIPRDFDDLIDGVNEEEDLDIDVDDEEDVKCLVDAKRPYSVSPTITFTGIKDRFNVLLVGYDTHTDDKRTNKGSLYGWSTPKNPSPEGVTKINFDLDYVSILPQGGMPLSYCALVFVPPVVPKFDTQSVFGKPAMSLARYVVSEEHLVKALKKKSRKISSCCFVAYPMVSRR